MSLGGTLGGPLGPLGAPREPPESPRGRKRPKILSSEGPTQRIGPFSAPGTSPGSWGVLGGGPPSAAWSRCPLARTGTGRCPTRSPGLCHTTRSRPRRTACPDSRRKCSRCGPPRPPPPRRPAAARGAARHGPTPLPGLLQGGGPTTLPARATPPMPLPRTIHYYPSTRRARAAHQTLFPHRRPLSRRPIFSDSVHPMPNGPGPGRPGARGRGCLPCSGSCQLPSGVTSSLAPRPQ